MSGYYTSRRTRNLYRPDDIRPYKLSRSKIDLFLECPRCFYLDRRLGVGRPPGFPFTLNSAVDELLKREFDTHRARGSTHPLIEEYGVDAMPVPHNDLEKWRQNFVGVQYVHQATNLVITGAIDDLWQDSRGGYIVVDYKATATNEKITELNKAHHAGYKRQMEIYQWLLRRNGLLVSDTGYFVYCNGLKDRGAFDAKLEFEVTLIPYRGNDGWVERAVIDAYECLRRDCVPDAAAGCDYCAYLNAAEAAIAEHNDYLSHG